MGKRIELETIWRAGTKPVAVAARNAKTGDVVKVHLNRTDADILAHKRALKAAQMRRWRARNGL